MPGRQPTELAEADVRAAQQGDDAACRALLARYRQPVFALLTRVLAVRGRRAVVEDLAQETFLRVFRRLPDWTSGGPARLSTWILTIATRLALDELRRRPAEPEPPQAIDDPESLVHRRSIGEAIRRAALSLPHDQRAVFVLRDYHELDYEEIAEALGIELGTVKSRLFRARAALRRALAEVKDE